MRIYHHMMSFFKSYKILILVPLVFTLTYGCSGTYTSEDKAKKVVAKYVSLVTVAYKNGKFEELMKIAGGPVIIMVDNTYSAYKNGSGIVLDSTLVELNFNEVVIGSGKEDTNIEVVYVEEDKEWVEKYVTKSTVVKTTEIWKYKWVNYKTNEPASPIYTVRYEVEYTMDYLQGVLKILNVNVINELVLSQDGTGVEWKGNLSSGIRVH